MGKSNYWGAATVMVLLAGLAIWAFASGVKEQEGVLNQLDAFVYEDNDILYWIELTSRNRKVEGTFHQQRIAEKEDFPFTGKETKEGYEFKMEKHGETLIYDVKTSGSNLLVKKKGEKDSHLYKGINRRELTTYVEANREYHTEYEEKNQQKQFFTELNRVYGYLYAEENGSYLLFLKIDEALLQGELSGSLLVMTARADSDNPYEESRYVMNGITDGERIELFTTVGGKSIKLDGNFHKKAAGLDLLFWKTDEKLRFHAVTEGEYHQSYEEFKTKALK